MPRSLAIHCSGLKINTKIKHKEQTRKTQKTHKKHTQKNKKNTKKTKIKNRKMSKGMRGTPHIITQFLFSIA